MADGLSSDQIRSLVQDPDGTLWIGTFGGGLNALRDGRFYRYTARDGLLSDNIAHIEDDGRGSLWLATTRGICRIASASWNSFDGHKIRVALAHQLRRGGRTAQRAMRARHSHRRRRRTDADGRLWFPTSRGLAVLDPDARKRDVLPPLVNLVDVVADNRREVDFSQPVKIAAGQRPRADPLYRHSSQRARARALFVHAGRAGRGMDAVGDAPRHQLQQPAAWSLPFCGARGTARRTASERSFAFELLPHFYETIWFRCLCVALLLAGRLGRLPVAPAADPQPLRAGAGRARAPGARDSRYAGAGLRRHLLAAGRGGDVHARTSPTRRARYLDLARKMARHSLTEARRSVMDLRASVLEGQDLAAALQSGTRSGPRARTWRSRSISAAPRIRSRRTWSSTCSASRRRPSPTC